MRILTVATQHPNLLMALQSLARQQGVLIIQPSNFEELAGDAVAVIIDPACVPATEWKTYLDYLHELGGEDSTPLIVLHSHHGLNQQVERPGELACKPAGAFHRLADFEVERICSIVEEALLGTRNQWNVRKPLCVAPHQLDVEECYIAKYFPDDYVVVVWRPDNKPSFALYHQIAEQAKVEEDQVAASSFLAFPFSSEEEARNFADTVPEGMAALYAQGRYLDINCE